MSKLDDKKDALRVIIDELETAIKACSNARLTAIRVEILDDEVGLLVLQDDIQRNQDHFRTMLGNLPADDRSS